VVKQLGARMREIRKERSLTLKQLSEMAGLSVGFLSEIERGRAEPSMASLRKIRQALGISLISLRSGEGLASDRDEPFPLPASGLDKERLNITEAKLVRAGERKKLAYPKQPGFYELLTPDLNRRLEVLYFKVDEEFSTGTEPLVDPPGEKCMVILSGHILFRVGEETFDMRGGDSLSYPADSPVSWTVPRGEGAEGILVVTPPGF